MFQTGIGRRTEAASSALTDADVWSKLNANASTEEFVAAWLWVMSSQIPGCRKSLVRIELSEEELAQSTWPQGEAADELVRPIEDAVERRRGVVAVSPGGSGVLAAFPIIIGENAIGAVAILLGETDRGSLLNAMRLMQWGTAWLRERGETTRLSRQDSRNSTAYTVLELLAVALEERLLVDSARALVTAIAEMFGCERVSIGQIQRGETKVLAISHTAHFGREMNLVDMVSQAMNEAADERRVIVFNDLGRADAEPAHQTLSRAHGAGSIMTAPIALEGENIGALTLERDRQIPFTTEEAVTIDLLATSLAPILDTKRMNERTIFRRLLDDAVSLASRFFAADSAAYKFSAIATVSLLLLFVLWTGKHEVVGDARVEGRQQRVISAGYDGFLSEALVRAGDRVIAGQLLARLDEKDLVLEQIRWEAEKKQHNIAYEKALSERDRSGIRVAESLVAQADAQIKLIEEKLSRSRMTAPYDGIIVSGDLSQDIGIAVQRGQPLFEIAPASAHRIIVNVAETDIVSLKEGQNGNLVLAALPGERFEISVYRITPVASIIDGKNVFEVEAWPASEANELRPGLRGVVKIDVGRARVIWIWTHSFFDWLRMVLWRIF